MQHLTPEQRDAIDRVRARACAGTPAARARIDASLRAAHVPIAAYDEAIARLREQCQVALAFHPERLARDGRTVAEGLLADGVYKSQFETGLSGGSASAFVGGERDAWERRLFDGAYHTTDGTPSTRPKYGALVLVAHPDGPAPRFGSCHLVLRPEVTARCTFTCLGSQDSEAEAGTLDALDPVIAALLRHVEADPAPLGVPGLTVRDLVAAMRTRVPCLPPGASRERQGRALDSFVEAQVHGDVVLARDAEALVVDASFRGHAVGVTLGELAARHHLALSWHPGFSLAIAAVPETFRDHPIRGLAGRITAATIDAATLGAAYNDHVRDPDAWRSFGSPSAIRTGFRRLWHALVLLGGPVRRDVG